ncbi:MAG: substrate-binding domain-containing protein [Alphaproteobacteria bacterium]|nr:substrate-binding domain-containing protein [Alphaproteobacteria bacterium]
MRAAASLPGVALIAALVAISVGASAQGVPQAPPAQGPLVQTPPPRTGIPSAAPDVSTSPNGFELVDPKVLRVCADPNNLPFSNEAGEGFENKIAALLAKELGKDLSFTWYPSGPGFVRRTLAAYRCDLIMGMPQGDDIVQVTNPYYFTTYALVFALGHGLDGVETLADPRLQEKRIGIVAGTPPSTNLVLDGLMAKAKPYPLVVDTRYDSSAVAMMQDIADGSIDAGVLWGPFAGYYAKQAKSPVAVVPLLKEPNGPRMRYRIGMGVRYTDQEWKRELNRLIKAKQSEITALLQTYGVPLLDESERLIAPTSRSP